MANDTAITVTMQLTMAKFMIPVKTRKEVFSKGERGTNDIAEIKILCI